MICDDDDDDGADDAVFSLGFLVMWCGVVWFDGVVWCQILVVRALRKRHQKMNPKRAQQKPTLSCGAPTKKRSLPGLLCRFFHDAHLSSCWCSVCGVMVVMMMMVLMMLYSA